LPYYLDALSDETTTSRPATEVRYPAESNILRLCDQFLTELVDRSHHREGLERTIVLRDRNELLGSLQESLMELCAAANSNSQAVEVRTLINNQV
jgi:phosphate:Na+ symporter